MAENNKVVAHFLDDTLVKGTTLDFFANRKSFHLKPEDGGPTREIHCKDLKALFFVKHLAGHPGRESVHGFVAGPAETNQGRKIAVRFKDGELLCGYTLSYSEGREGFFLTPADTGSNNLRVYVLSAATSEVKIGPAAEALAKKAA
jgi:hypothetical protein